MSNSLEIALNHLVTVTSTILMLLSYHSLMLLTGVKTCQRNMNNLMHIKRM